MSIFNTITRFAFDYRARRRRLATYKEISNLPPAIRKDIGWPDPGTEQGGQSRHRLR